jgi:hypothetical protein
MPLNVLMHSLPNWPYNCAVVEDQVGEWKCPKWTKYYTKPLTYASSLMLNVEQLANTGQIGGLRHAIRTRESILT